MSDAASDIYYSGPSGGVGESVTEADREPSATGHPPSIVGYFFTDRYSVTSVTPSKLHDATVRGGTCSASRTGRWGRASSLG